MRACFSAVICLLAFLSPVIAGGWDDPRAGRPILDVWTDSDYDASGANRVVIRDRSGRVYVGNSGVLSFDGRRWSKININNAYGTRCLTLDEQDRIWLGAVNEIGFLEPSSLGERRYRSLTHLVPEEVEIPDVWGVHRLNGKTLFVLTQGVLVWDG
ncbi:MAG: hypothetical protein ACREIA_15685, partial [Opitutaceae bacterium]